MAGHSESYRVFVTRVINPTHFYARMGSAVSFEAFNVFEGELQTHCQQYKFRASTDNLEQRQIVLAKNQDGKWLRGWVNNIQKDEVDILAIDYYTTEFIPVTNIIDEVPVKFSSPPPQAFKCAVVGIKPIAHIWISRSVDYFTNLVLNETFDGEIVHYDGHMDSVIYMDLFIEESETSSKLASDLLIKAGLAMKADDKTDLNHIPVNIPRFNIDLLTQTVERNTSIEEEPGEPNFEQEIFCGDMIRSDSLETNEMTDYNSQPAPRSSKFGSIKEMISSMKGSSTQSSDGSNASSPVRFVQDGHQDNSPARSRHTEKQPALETKEKITRTGSGHRIVKEHRSGSGHSSPRSSSPWQQRNTESPKDRAPKSNSPIVHYQEPPPPQRKLDSPSHSLSNHTLHATTHTSSSLVSHHRQHETHSQNAPSQKQEVHRQRTPSQTQEVHSQQQKLENSQSAPSHQPEVHSQNTSSRKQEVQTTHHTKHSEAPATRLKSAGDSRKVPSHSEKKALYQKQKIKFQRQMFMLLMTYENADSTRQSSIIQDIHELVFPIPVRSLIGCRGKIVHSKDKLLRIGLSVRMNSTRLSWRVLNVIRTAGISINQSSSDDEGVQSSLKELPGPKELPLMLEVLLEQAVIGPNLHRSIAEIFHTFIDSPQFPTVISEKLWFYHDTYIKKSKQKKMSAQFSEFLAHLFISALEWRESNERDSVNVCIINMVEQWRESLTLVAEPEKVELHIDCLMAFFTIAGHRYEEYMPTECGNVLNTARDLLFTSRLSRNLKERLFDLLELKIIWDVPVAPPVLEAPAHPPKPDVVSRLVQTDTLHTRDFEVQIDIELPRPVSEVQQPEAKVVSFDLEDEFWKVKVMLNELNLESLEEIFVENAVMDDLLDEDFNELKDLLKECGLKPGHITRFKIYLKNTEKRQETEARALGNVTDKHQMEAPVQQQAVKVKPKMAAAIHLVAPPSKSKKVTKQVAPPSPEVAPPARSHEELAMREASLPLREVVKPSHSETSIHQMSPQLYSVPEATQQMSAPTYSEESTHQVSAPVAHNTLSQTDISSDKTSLINLIAPSEFQTSYNGQGDSHFTPHNYFTDPSYNRYMEPPYMRTDIRAESPYFHDDPILYGQDDNLVNSRDDHVAATNHAQHSDDRVSPSYSQELASTTHDSKEANLASQHTKEQATSQSDVESWRSHDGHKSEPDPVDAPAQNGDTKHHPSNKYNLKSVRTLAVSWLRSNKAPGTQIMDARAIEEEEEDPYHERKWKVESMEGEVYMPPPLNLAPSEFPQLSREPMTKAERRLSESPPTPRSYLPPPPSIPDKPHIHDFITDSKDSPPRRKPPGFSDAAEMAYSGKMVKFNDLGKSSTFGKNRRCTTCGSMNHIVDDCPDKSQKFFR